MQCITRELLVLQEEKVCQEAELVRMDKGLELAHEGWAAAQSQVHAMRQAVYQADLAAQVCSLAVTLLH